jgi:hypothetical protein
MLTSAFNHVLCFGGMKDDVVIALQLGIYYSTDPNMYK